MARPEAEACFWFVLLFAVAGVLIGAFAFVKPVRVTVDAATLTRLELDLAAPAGNLTGTAAASLTYVLDLDVSVYNPNWVMHVRRTAPLDAELRFRGWALDRILVAGSAANWRQISPHEMVSCGFTTGSVGMPVPAAALGRDGVEELARESAAGEFQLELVVTGQFKYETHSHKRSLRTICPLKLTLSTGKYPAKFTRVVCV